MRVEEVQRTRLFSYYDATAAATGDAAAAATSASTSAAAYVFLANEAVSAQEAADKEGFLIFNSDDATWHCDCCSMGSDSSGVCKCCAFFLSRHLIVFLGTGEHEGEIVHANSETHTSTARVSRRALVVRGASRIVNYKRRGTRAVSVR